MASLRPVSADEIESLAIGAWILGTGGGGSPYLALLNMRQLYREGVVVSLMDADASWPTTTSWRSSPTWARRWSARSASPIPQTIALRRHHDGGVPRPASSAP